MNYRKQIKLALIALVFILCTQGKPAAAKGTEDPRRCNRDQRQTGFRCLWRFTAFQKNGNKEKFSKKNIYRRLLQSHVTRQSGWI